MTSMTTIGTITYMGGRARMTYYGLLMVIDFDIIRNEDISPISILTQGQ